MKEEYPEAKSDLFAAFIERCTDLARPLGLVAMITMQSWMFLSSYEKLRVSLLTRHQITSMLHLGARAFDSIGGEVVSSTAFVLRSIPLADRSAVRQRAGAFIRLVDGTSESEKVAALRAALAGRTRENGFHLALDTDFTMIPGSPIVYWLTEKVLHVFRDMDTLGMHSRAAKGLVTADNATFVRCWWEVSRDKTGFDYASREEARSSKKRWFPYANGGLFRKWAGNMDSVVDWEDDGRRLQTTLTTDGCRIRATNFNLNRIFLPAIVWTVVTSGEQSFRVAPRGSLFDAAAGMCQSNKEEVLLAVLNSRVAALMLSALNPTLNLHPGYLEAVPIPANVSAVPVEPVKCLVKLSENDWNSRETSWEFTKNPLVALTEQK